MRMPFCDPKSNAEFVGNILFQTMIAAHGILMYIGMEIFLSLFQNAVTIAPHLVESDLQNVIKLYEDKSISETELYWRIGRIAKTSIDADK